MQETVLQVEGLTVARDQHIAVDQVSFSVLAGTNVAIVGPNGAGKSTLIQAILGILPRQSGQVDILGYPLSPKGNLPKGIRDAIAYLPQNFGFDRRIPMIVEEVVGLGWQTLGQQWPWSGRQARQEAVHQALAKVEALHLQNQRVGDLSGGETKRVLLAYCLVQPRRLLILDEAPAGLDARGEAEFYQLLYQLKQDQGWAILQVSHDLNRVQRQCDHVLCLNRTLLCAGIPDVALSRESLSAAYGPEFARYHHSHSLS
ncbi:MAG: metal ABC transporter ATP-binding protein [Acaryochloris sp. RU_4_1]|nr:metal ABC transporter ATP-binding protein [Acaryochloris sp. RU_4_1]NJR53551.1 metal ABC transporter ATP-binding protein [Acaryochloris sp. CRU_2_0]